MNYCFSNFKIKITNLFKINEIIKIIMSNSFT